MLKVNEWLHQRYIDELGEKKEAIIRYMKLILKEYNFMTIDFDICYSVEFGDDIVIFSGYYLKTGIKDKFTFLYSTLDKYLYINDELINNIPFIHKSKTG